MVATGWFWPDSHFAALKEHLLAGLSYSQAAAAMNADFGTSYSRSACIGKGRRMRIGSVAKSPRQAPSSDERKRRKNERERARREAKPHLFRAAEERFRERQKKKERLKMAANNTPQSSPVYRNQLPRIPEMTKGELRAMLTQAVQNTAAMGVT